MTKGRFTRDFYLLPTILIHRGDGIYSTIEFAWLKWYIGISWQKKCSIGMSSSSTFGASENPQKPFKEKN